MADASGYLTLRALLLAGLFRGEEELLEHVLRKLDCGTDIEGEFPLGAADLAHLHQRYMLDVADVTLCHPPALGGGAQIDISTAEPGLDQQGGHLLAVGRDGVERLVFHSVLASILGPLLTAEVA